MFYYGGSLICHLDCTAEISTVPAVPLLMPRVKINLSLTRWEWGKNWIRYFNTDVQMWDGLNREAGTFLNAEIYRWGTENSKIIGKKKLQMFAQVPKNWRSQMPVMDLICPHTITPTSDVWENQCVQFCTSTLFFNWLPAACCTSSNATSLTCQSAR